MPCTAAEARLNQGASETQPSSARLSGLRIGARAEISEVEGSDALTYRLLELGLGPGVVVEVIRYAPLGDPLELRVRGYHLSLRKADAARVHVRSPRERPMSERDAQGRARGEPGEPSGPRALETDAVPSGTSGAGRSRAARVVLAGNPNVGKTSLFNAWTGSRHRVGNYAGVTVECREGPVASRWRPSRSLSVVDVPGTYSLTGLSDDERVAADAITSRALGEVDGLVVVLDATNLARNLYFALQLRELGLPLVVALNMSDEAAALGKSVDAGALSAALGVPVIPTVARDAVGLAELTGAVVAALAGSAPGVLASASASAGAHATPAAPAASTADQTPDHTDPSAAAGRTGSGEDAAALRGAFAPDDPTYGDLEARTLALGWSVAEFRRALGRAATATPRDGSAATEGATPGASTGSPDRVTRGASRALDLAQAVGAEPQVVWAAARALIAARWRAVDVICARVGWPTGDHRQAHDASTRAAGPSWSSVASRRPPSHRSQTERLDAWLTHPVVGPVAFVLIMGAVFNAIFTLAAPIMSWLERGVTLASRALGDALGPGALTGLLTDGVLSGVGNVVVFVPQIALLFVFLGLLEESGYMARAAFLIDRVMRGVGLNGRAFVPLLSGYACAIPAIMSTRTIDSFRDRLVTILMIPFMSCSARLPVYGLVAYALFDGTRSLLGPFTVGGALMLGMYVLGTVSALAVGALYRKTILPGPTPPLLLELPPYRRPRLAYLARMVWDRTADFLREAGTIILVFTILLWGLLTFPRVDPDTLEPGETPIERSIGGRVGKALEPALAPMGQDWRVGIALVGSFAAREVLVSTLGMVHGIESEEDAPVREAYRDAIDPETGERRNTPLEGLALMVFFVYAAQCMSTLAVVRRETGTWKWPIFMFVTMTTLAYVMATATYQVGLLLGYR